jgi:hypothetical protein
MALISCPDCGREISDQAKICVHCGRPADLPQQQQELRTQIQDADAFDFGTRIIMVSRQIDVYGALPGCGFKIRGRCNIIRTEKALIFFPLDKRLRLNPAGGILLQAALIAFEKYQRATKDVSYEVSDIKTFVNAGIAVATRPADITCFVADIKKDVLGYLSWEDASSKVTFQGRFYLKESFEKGSFSYGMEGRAAANKKGIEKWPPGEYKVSLSADKSPKYWWEP